MCGHGVERVGYLGPFVLGTVYEGSDRVLCNLKAAVGTLLEMIDARRCILVSIYALAGTALRGIYTVPGSLQWLAMVL
jgi:hypothetical protein